MLKYIEENEHGIVIFASITIVVFGSKPLVGVLWMIWGSARFIVKSLKEGENAKP